MKISFLFCLLLIVLSCDRNDSSDINDINNISDCEDLSLESTSLEESYGCVNTKYQLEINLEEMFLVITNQTEFNQLVSGSCNPEIDFTLHDLVIGKKGFESGISSIDYNLIEECKSGDFSLSINFQKNETTEAPNITYHQLIPKLSEGQGLSVNLIIN